MFIGNARTKHDIKSQAESTLKAHTHDQRQIRFQRQDLAKE